MQLDKYTKKMYREFFGLEKCTFKSGIRYVY